MEPQTAQWLQGGICAVQRQPAQGLANRCADRLFSPEGHAYGRPVGVAMDPRGAVLVADDVGNVVWRVSGQAQTVVPGAAVSVKP